MRASSLRLVDGTDELVLVPDTGASRTSPIYVVSNQLEFPSVRAVEYDKLGRSGKADLSYLHSSSSFSAQLKIVGDQDLTRHEYLDLLKGFLAPGKRPYLFYKRDGWAAERRCELRGDDASCVVNKESITRLEVSIQAVIPAGVAEDIELSTVTMRFGSTNTGISAPLVAPISATPGNTVNSYFVAMTGNTVAQPYIRVFGGCSNPRLYVSLDDGPLKQLSLIDASIPSGHYLDIDFENRKVFLDGTEANSYYSKVDFSVSEWWDLRPGSNKLLFSSDSPDDSSYAEVSYRNTWLT